MNEHDTNVNYCSANLEYSSDADLHMLCPSLLLFSPSVPPHGSFDHDIHDDNDYTLRRRRRRRYHHRHHRSAPVND